eukprot:6446261-Alexandrium_andersonii.AAC.1
MSASLVGSEMCIRDRVEADRALPGIGNRLEVSPLVQEGLRVGGRRRRRPVSYTHLTLPTICSV